MAGRLISAFLLFLSIPALAAAQPSNNDEEARMRFRAGEAAYARGDYQAALDDFERAYSLSQRPGLLFNVGLAAQRARRRERALEAFREYLRLTPDADNRADVESRIAELEELIAAQQAREGGGQTGGGETGGGETGGGETGGDTTVIGGGGEVDGGGGGPGIAPWILIGGGGAVLVGGVVLFVMAQGDIASVEDPEEGATWSDVMAAHDRAPTLSTIGLVMIGAGVAAGAVGVVLLTGGDDGGAETEVSLVPGGAVLRGTF